MLFKKRMNERDWNSISKMNLNFYTKFFKQRIEEWNILSVFFRIEDNICHKNNIKIVGNSRNKYLLFTIQLLFTFIIIILFNINEIEYR